MYDKDPFDKFLQDAAQDQTEHERLVRQFNVTFKELEMAFLAHEDVIEEEEGYLIGTLARELARIQITDDSNEKRQLEKEFLAHLHVNHHATTIEIIQACHPMPPLTEEDASLLAEMITRKEVQDEHFRAIASRVDEIIDEYEILTGDEIEIAEDGIFLHRLVEYYEYIVYQLDEDKDTKQRKLINLRETANVLASKFGFHPILVKAIHTLADEAPIS